MSYKGSALYQNACCGILSDEIRDIITIIWKIDFTHEIDLLKIEHSNIADEAKQARKFSIVLEHHDRRQPYIKLLNERWQKQYRRSMAA